jgi:integrase
VVKLLYGCGLRLFECLQLRVKDFIWQWFFPQKSLTQVPSVQELRRYHLHETHVQEALYEAVRRAKLTKRVTSHTFRIRHGRV